MNNLTKTGKELHSIFGPLGSRSNSLISSKVNTSFNSQSKPFSTENSRNVASSKVRKTNFSKNYAKESEKSKVVLNIKFSEKDFPED